MLKSKKFTCTCRNLHSRPCTVCDPSMIFFFIDGPHSIRCQGVGLIGDSTKALSWMKEEKYRAGAVSFTLIALEFGFVVSDNLW